MKPKVAILVEHRYGFSTSKALESIRSNAELAEMLVRDMNFIYPVRHYLRQASIQLSRTLTPFHNRRPVMAGNVIVHTGTLSSKRLLM